MNRRITRRGTAPSLGTGSDVGDRPAPLRTRALAVRPARLTAAGLTLIALGIVLLLVWAAAAHASVWVIPAMDRAYPTTKPGLRQSIAIDAAGNEYQGVQVCLRGGGDHMATFTWSADSEPLIVANAKLHRVYFVNVTTPTTHLGSRRGLYPDPLVPREFGARLGVPGSTTPYYILVHVPYGTPAGTYDGDAARRERHRSRRCAVQPARLGLRLAANQHAVGVRCGPEQHRARACRAGFSFERREQADRPRRLLRDDEGARDLADHRPLPSQGDRLRQRGRAGLGEQGGAAPRRERRRPPGQPAAVPALVPVESP